MALALASASERSAQSPTRHLQDALVEFQSILSDSEKVQLKNLKQVPDADAVLTFTASLDRMNPNRRGRSVATRLYSFLQSVQQFTGVVDVFVSSNPSVAALVWGSVRFTMMVRRPISCLLRSLLTYGKFMVNFTSYFQDLSKLLLGFETWCPRYEEHRLLFPSSIRLQESLSRFYALIVRCCKDIIVITRRSCELAGS
jgi:hypothetical protein